MKSIAHFINYLLQILLFQNKFTFVCQPVAVWLRHLFINPCSAKISRVPFRQVMGLAIVNGLLDEVIVLKKYIKVIAEIIDFQIRYDILVIIPDNHYCLTLEQFRKGD